MKEIWGFGKHEHVGKSLGENPKRLNFESCSNNNEIAMACGPFDLSPFFVGVPFWPVDSRMQLL